MNKKLLNLILLFIFVPIILIGITEAATTKNFSQNRILTNYWPVSGSGTQSMEGGLASATRGLDGRSTVKTLEMVRTGQSSYVTIAADPSYYGSSFIIPEITYKNARGETHRLTNVQAYVHDTGSAFRADRARSLSPSEVPRELRSQYPNGMTREENAAYRLRKFDVAYDISSSDANANMLSRGQPSVKNVTFNPNNEKARQVIANQNNQPTQPTQPTQTTQPTQPTQTTQSTQPTQTTTVTRNPASTSGGGFLWDARDRYCHKHTGPAARGELKMAMTCNAGFKCIQTSCGDDPCYYSVFVNDCGPRNANCDSAAYISGGGWCPPKESNPQDGPQAGCLNYKCKNKPNAIWDMGSKKCGCG